MYWLSTHFAKTFVHNVAAANTAASFAHRSDIANDVRFKVLVVAVEEKLLNSYFGMREIGNLLQAFGAMGVGSDTFVRYVEDRTEKIMVEADPQTISNISYAFAKLEERRAKR